jgi:hypothetical protein
MLAGAAKTTAGSSCDCAQAVPKNAAGDAPDVMLLQQAKICAKAAQEQHINLNINQVLVMYFDTMDSVRIHILSSYFLIAYRPLLQGLFTGARAWAWNQVTVSVS